MTKLAVSLCSSCCGTKVHVDVPVAAVSAAASAEAEGVARVGVLILGFSGCSLEQMKPARSVYMSRWPAWRVVAAVRPGLRWGLYASGSDESELFEADRAAERVLSDQRNAVLAQLEGVDKIMVHCMSNNGHCLWRELLRHCRAELAPRLAALVLDCGPAVASQLSATCASQALLHTIVTTAATLDVPITTTKPGVRGVELLAEACTACAGQGPRDQGPGAIPAALDDALALADQGSRDQGEPPVVTLLLTSATDAVVPEAAVRHFAEEVRTAQPDRPLSIARLKGAHCRLAVDDADNYRGQLEALAATAGLC